MLVDLVLTHKFTLLMDYKIACEYRAVALRPEHILRSHLAKWQIEALIGALESVAEPVEVIWKHRPLSIDSDDDLVLDLAINGYADVIVTNNIRH